MPRLALKLNDTINAAVRELTGSDEKAFADNSYMIVEVLSPTEFNLKIATEDEIVDAFMHDSTMQIVSF